MPIHKQGMRKRTASTYLKIFLAALTLCWLPLAWAQKKGPVNSPTKSLLDSGVPDADVTCRNLGKPRVACPFGGVWIDAICQCGPNPSPAPTAAPENSNADVTYGRCANGDVVTSDMLNSCESGNFDRQTCGCKSAPPTTSNSGQTCNGDKVDQLYNQCATDVAAAVTSCDNDQDSGIQSAKSQLSDFAVSLGSQVAVSKACSGIAKYVGVLNGAVAAFVGYCNNSRDTCIASCKQAAAQVETPNLACFTGKEDPRYEALKEKIDAQMQKCVGLNVKAAQATTAVSNIANTVSAARNCATATQATPEYCTAHPGTPGCTTAAADCNDPTIRASNPICFCSQPDSAMNPKCNGVLRAGTNNDIGTSTITSTAAASGMPTFSASKDPWTPSAALKGAGGAGEDPGGKKGGRALEAGSAGSGGAGDPGGAAAGGGTSPQINNGFRGGSSGGGGWTVGGGSGGGSGYGGGTGGNGTGGAGSGPDLRQFLPGGKFAPGSHGVGGLTGLSGPDGITGPHDNIFRKIKNRYQSQRPTFLGQ